MDLVQFTAPDTAQGAGRHPAVPLQNNDILSGARGGLRTGQKDSAALWNYPSDGIFLNAAPVLFMKLLVG
jgi:hypothetical protein